MRYGFAIDQRTCIGCHACTVACKTEHRVPVGQFRTWVKYVDSGTFPDSRRDFGVMRCNHCTDFIDRIANLTYRPGASDRELEAVVERIKTGEQYSIMFAKDSPLAAEVSKAIGELKADGFLSKLHETWFGSAPDASTSTATNAEMPKL